MLIAECSWREPFHLGKGTSVCAITTATGTDFWSPLPELLWEVEWTHQERPLGKEHSIWKSFSSKAGARGLLGWGCRGGRASGCVCTAPSPPSATNRSSSLQGQADH